jgi:hypothetical protein
MGMTMYESKQEMISALMAGTAEQLDIPPELRIAAEREYALAGGWLAEHAEPDGQGWRVYSQGSFRIGTVVRPEGSDEYDLDAVCVRAIDRKSTSQAELKDELGGVLTRYVRARAADDLGPDGLAPRKRCWTMSYPVPFHMDVLPAIPNPETPPEGILLTDRDLLRWQPSNPIAYADWFELQMRRELVAKRAALSEAQHVPPEEIPTHAIKTTLQRVVQVLKVHRNRYFADDLGSRPASVLVSTLAALAYEGEAFLDQAVLETVRAMPALLSADGDEWSLPNPAEPRENFAEKWNEHGELADGFFSWIGQLEEDVLAARESEGIDRAVLALSEGFGEPVRKAAAGLADGYLEDRQRGALRFSTASGALAATGELAVRGHDFYGAR